MRSERPSAYIGIDLGSSACKLIAIDQDSHIIISQRIIIEDNATEQNPEHQWQTVLKGLEQLIPHCSDYQLKAICVDATSGSVMLTNEQGRPITPILMYNDNRAIEQSLRIARIAPDNTGAQGPTSGLAKLCYFQQQTKTTDYQLLHQADWINFKLGAPLGITDENNALKTAYDPVKRHWPGWLNQIINPKVLPSVVPAGKKIGRLSPALCQHFNIEEVPDIIAGTTDSIAGVLATGINKIGQAVTSLGSTLTIKLISDKPIFKAEQGLYSHRLGQHWLIGGASNTGGAVLKHFFTSQELAELSQQIDIHQPTEDYYPLLNAGERFPINDPTLQPRLTPRSKSDIAFCHSLLQSITNIELLAYQALQIAGASEVSSIDTVRGGASNSAWLAIRQHTLKIPISIPTYTEAAYGSARIAQGKLITPSDEN